MNKINIQKFLLLAAAASISMTAGCSNNASDSSSSSETLESVSDTSDIKDKSESSDDTKNEENKGPSDKNTASNSDNDSESKSQPETSDDKTESEEKTESNDDAERKAAYKAALEGIFYNNVYPDGSDCGMFEGSDMYDNQFAIYDVDKDGKDELIVKYTTTATAGMIEYIFDYDNSGNAVVQFSEFPSMTFYDNGIIEVGASHNQGYSGEFWPYSLYQYNSGSDTYDPVAHVSAYDKALVDSIAKEQIDSGFTPNVTYPDNIDTSKSGFVYFIIPEGESKSDPVDVTKYDEWHDSFIGGASVIEIPFVSFTEENISGIS